MLERETFQRDGLTRGWKGQRDERQINLLERQELQRGVKFYLINRGPPEHWLFSGMFKRVELQKALGNHLSWKER
ncbi:hypothetical protein RHGRI_026163 [Rhododendron griersonianum]|uniref:Ycf15 n=1 Tax=Rhododendron griersonianum TaxID=479676 RepID=A0AAV6IRM9_9ERIC|nr:hypothetical protein RHGRI_026163 [Rhododendron griersonianum]